MATTSTADKWKSKMWFNVYTPKIFGETIIGEMPAQDEKKAIGRVMKLSMSWVTHKPEHSFMLVGLKVVDATGNSAKTQLDYIEQTFSYLHSLVKRHQSVIYTIDKLKGKDGKEFVVKLVIVLQDKIATPKKKGLRKGITNFMKEYVKTQTQEEFIKDVIDSKFQVECANKVSNIAGINKIELKRIEL